jgi:hypothetical protein
VCAILKVSGTIDPHLLALILRWLGLSRAQSQRCNHRQQLDGNSTHIMMPHRKTFFLQITQTFVGSATECDCSESHTTWPSITCISARTESRSMATRNQQRPMIKALWMLEMIANVCLRQAGFAPTWSTGMIFRLLRWTMAYAHDHRVNKVRMRSNNHALRICASKALKARILSSLLRKTIVTVTDMPIMKNALFSFCLVNLR